MEDRPLKKAFYLGLAAVLVMALVGTALAETATKMTLKVGDEVYACNCGPGCDCFTMSRNHGKCVCGQDMVLAKVTKVENGKAYLQAEKWENPRAFLTQGKYACACGPQCDCNTISQKPGKCVCGTEMKKVM